MRHPQPPIRPLRTIAATSALALLLAFTASWLELTALVIVIVFAALVAAVIQW